jgi:hypothetical protein
MYYKLSEPAALRADTVESQQNIYVYKLLCLRTISVVLASSLAARGMTLVYNQALRKNVKF